MPTTFEKESNPPEWMASATMLTDPARRPKTAFATATARFSTRTRRKTRCTFRPVALESSWSSRSPAVPPAAPLTSGAPAPALRLVALEDLRSSRAPVVPSVATLIHRGGGGVPAA
ncbi:hypothetical protein [Methanoculleus chikugoensis]|uniref:hypothetical protein n=1 Tax=Methanoculleus chikugoensis TaxID=118126 RepID=UPI001FB35C7A|nr:hypothetical protein [Methanoculleus chikugoensis]